MLGFVPIIIPIPTNSKSSLHPLMLPFILLGFLIEFVDNDDKARDAVIARQRQAQLDYEARLANYKVRLIKGE